MSRRKLHGRRKTHRDFFRPIIAKLIEELGTDDVRILKSELQNHFNWNMRSYHKGIAYDELRVQLRLPRKPKVRQRLLAAEAARGQKYLFEVV